MGTLYHICASESQEHAQQDASDAVIAELQVDMETRDQAQQEFDDAVVQDTARLSLSASQQAKRPLCQSTTIG